VIYLVEAFDFQLAQKLRHPIHPSVFNTDAVISAVHTLHLHRHRYRQFLHRRSQRLVPVTDSYIREFVVEVSSSWKDSACASCAWFDTCELGCFAGEKVYEAVYAFIDGGLQDYVS